MTDWLTEEQQNSGPEVHNFTFGEALMEAAGVGDTVPLADFIRDADARSTIPESLWTAFADFLASLGKTRRPGNPANTPTDPLIQQAAERYDAAKKRWRRRNGRKHVPPSVSKMLLSDAIKWLGEQTSADIPEHSGAHANLARQIDIICKAGRV